MKQNHLYLEKIEELTYRNFKNVKDISFIKEDDSFYPWTIFLGNNGTGKTNLLKILSFLEVQKNKRAYWPIIEERKYTPKKDLNGRNTEAILSSIFIDKNNKRYSWGFDSKKNLFTEQKNDVFYNLMIYSYGVNRRISITHKDPYNQQIDNSATLFDHNVEFLNLEWLLKTDYAVKNNSFTAKQTLEDIKELFASGIFPDIIDLDCEMSTDQTKNFVLFKTKEGSFKLEDLPYGYQSSMAWIIDFCKKMFDRYPTSGYPLREPAIVLIDEIDLHLHPEWQRKITKTLSKTFPKTQFIATTHSPFVVQSVEEANVYILNKETNTTTIDKVHYTSFQGWSVEDILSRVMGLGSKVKSDKYLELVKDFDIGLDNGDYQKSKEAFDQLMEILPENGIQRKKFTMQINQFPEAR